MRSILNIAIKDIRLLLRDRMAAFFVLGFPLMMGLFFGMMINPGSGKSRTKLNIAVVDQDQSAQSKQFTEALGSNENLNLERDDLDSARASIQSGKRIAMLVIPAGFGETAGLFWQQQVPLQLGIDPSRSAEGGMVEGFIMEAASTLVGQRLSDPSQLLRSTRQWSDQVSSSEDLSEERRSSLLELYSQMDSFLNALDLVQQAEKKDATADANDDPQPSVATPNTASGFQLASIEKIDVMRQPQSSSIEGQIGKLRSRWDLSFPQAMLWGILGCVAGFAVSVAQEREAGTLTRLRVAPVSRGQLLSGKALACFLSTIGVVIAMTAFGLILGLQPVSIPKLIWATFAVAFCFVGIMLLLSTLGKSVQAVSGIGWSSNMIMAMIGGAMIPVMFMPAWISKLSVISPVRWAIQSLEGAIWRDFSWLQLLQSTSVLCLIGLGAVAVAIFRARQEGSEF